MRAWGNRGKVRARTTASRSAREPPKCGSSVSTDTATAPPETYARAVATGSSASRIAPAEGERRFTSAITATAPPESAGANGRGGGAFAARRSKSRMAGRSASKRRRVAARIVGSVGAGMLAFGALSGRLRFGLFSGDQMPLTRRQHEILDYITGYIADNGYAPSFEEIARKFGFQSLATVHEHLTNLQPKAYIHRHPTES